MSTEAPPTRGIKVHAEEGGVVAWVYPNPSLTAAHWAALLFSLGGGGLIGFFLEGDDTLRMTVAGGVAVFGALLTFFHQGARLFPVEVALEAEKLVWSGERIRLSEVAGCEVGPRTLVVKGADGVTLAELEGAEPGVTAWLGEQIEAARSAPA